jgi:signal peptidase I
MELTKRAKFRREAVSLGRIFGVMLLFRAFIAQAYVIPSGSMEPTLMVGDHIYVNRVVYRFDKPQRGEVVVFDHPREHGKDLIKRVVAIGGDRVEGHDGQVWVNGSPSGPSFDFSALEVPDDNLFVMGDNRDNSSDSRFWGFVPRGLVQGRAMFVWWNSDDMGRAFHAIR